MEDYNMACQRTLLIIKKWSPTTPIAEIDFTSSDSWIQIHGLAPISMLKENATSLGNLLGSSTEIDFMDNSNMC